MHRTIRRPQPRRTAPRSRRLVQAVVHPVQEVHEMSLWWYMWQLRLGNVGGPLIPLLRLMKRNIYIFKYIVDGPLAAENVLFILGQPRRGAPKPFLVKAHLR